MQAGDVISYLEMCSFESASLQRGMNFRLDGSTSVILMSTRTGAPYDDRIEDDGRVLIYEGHDVPRSAGGVDPKAVDQPMRSNSGRLTQNGRFFEAALSHRDGGTPAQTVRVYEKVRPGIWVFNGPFGLVDAWREDAGSRLVFKFRLELGVAATQASRVRETPRHSRLIPSSVKQEVWKRDKGRCIKCDSDKNLHFDHVIPFSMGGSSLVAANIQLLCALHNLRKGASLTG